MLTKHLYTNPCDEKLLHYLSDVKLLDNISVSVGDIEAKALTLRIVVKNETGKPSITKIEIVLSRKIYDGLNSSF